MVKTNWINKFEGIFGNVGNLERIWKEIARNSKEFEGMRRDFERTFEAILKGFEKKEFYGALKNFEKMKNWKKYKNILENWKGILTEFIRSLTKFCKKRNFKDLRAFTDF